MIRGLALIVLLTAANAPAFTVGPEHPLTEPRIVPIGGFLADPIVVSSNAGYFVVWTQNNDIMGVRIAPDGRVLDRRPIVISFNLNGSAPAATWNGSEWIVFWNATRIPGLWMARIATDGEMRLRERVDESEPVSEQVVAWNGISYLLVGATSSAVRARRFDANGTKIISIALTPEEGGFANPAIATNGQDFVAVWDEFFSSGSRVWRARLSAEAEILDPAAVIATTRPQSLRPEPDVRWDGERYVVVWADRGVMSIDVTASGVPLGLPREIYAGGSNLQTNPRLSVGATTGLLVWKSAQPNREKPAEPLRFDLFGARMTRAMTVIDLRRMKLLASPGFESALPSAAAAIGDRHLVVWIDRDAWRIPGQTLLRATVVEPDEPLERAVEDGSILSTHVSYQDRPLLHGDGTNFLAIWIESLPDGRVELRARPLSSSLAPLGQESSAIMQTSPFQQITFDIAFAGDRYLLVWNSNDGSTVGRFLARDGSPLHEIRLPLGSYPFVASDGESFVVPYRLNSTSGIRRINPDGVAAGETTLPTYDPVVDVIFDGSHYMAILNSGYQLSAVRVSREGTLVDSQPIVLVRSPRFLNAHHTASSGDRTLVVWTEVTKPHATVDEYDLFGVIISSDGTVSAPFPISTAFGDEGTPRTVWSGREFFVVWSHAKQTEERGWYMEIRGTTVSESGVAGDDPTTGGRLIAASEHQFDLSGASLWNVQGRTLVLYRREQLETFVGPTRRLFTRWIGFERRRGARR